MYLLHTYCILFLLKIPDGFDCRLLKCTFIIYRMTDLQIGDKINLMIEDSKQVKDSNQVKDLIKDIQSNNK